MESGRGQAGTDLTPNSLEMHPSVDLVPHEVIAAQFH